MSIKSKVLATAATLTLVGGVMAAGALTTAGPAKAATPSCGATCINIWSNQFGSRFLMDVFRQGARVGQPIILFRGSNGDPAEDFTVDIQASVTTLAGIGLVSGLVALHFGADQAVEYEYAPFGVDSGLCVGVAATPFNGEGVTLQPCGVSGKTIWIERGVVFPASPTFSGIALINGGTTTFTHPQVLTYPANGFPTDLPRPQLFTHSLQQFSDGSVFLNQRWSSFLGVF